MWLDVGVWLAVWLVVASVVWRLVRVERRLAAQWEGWRGHEARLGEMDDRLMGVEARPVARVGAVVPDETAKRWMGPKIGEPGRLVPGTAERMGPVGPINPAVSNAGRSTPVPRSVPMVTVELRDRDEGEVRHTLEMEARRRPPVLEVDGVRYAAARSEGSVHVYREV